MRESSAITALLSYFSRAKAEMRKRDEQSLTVEVLKTKKPRAK
jgi:hypothetical protein